MFNELIFIESNKNTPNDTMMIPPIVLRLSMNSLAVLERTLLMITPNIENTIENPKTKNTVFRIMFTLLMCNIVPFLELNSVRVVPDMYARNAGIIGNIHGATKEPRPASSATNIVTSVISLLYNFSFKGLFHILIQSIFNQGDFIFYMNKRFIIVGIVLGIIVALAVIIGSPAIGGFDAMR